MNCHFRLSRFVPLLVLAVALAACGGQETAPEEPAKSAEEVRQEQEAARRSERAAELAGRVNELTAAAGDVGESSAALEVGAPADIEAAVNEVEAKRAEAERLLAELQQAGAEGFDDAQARLEAALGELDRASADASAGLEEWARREAAALAARGEGAPIDPQTGLIEGLDGGDYEQYLVSVVKRVQERLREQGRYAGPADGRFDRPTMEALGSFQKEQELQVSGVPSPMTRSRLFDG